MADEPAPEAEPVVRDMPFRAVALSVIVGTATVVALQVAQPVVVPLLLALLFAYALEPAVAVLVRIRVPRTVAAVLVFGLVLAGINATGRMAVDRVNGFLADLPMIVAAVKGETAKGPDSPSVVGDLGEAASELQKATTAVAGDVPPRATPVTVVAPPFDLSSVFFANGVTVVAAIAYAIAVAVLTFLLLATGDISRRKIVKLGGARLESRKVTIEVLKAIDRQVERYLVVRLLISAIVAALTALALWPLGLHHWLGWGIAAGALNVVPFVGPTAAVAMIAAAAFLQFKSAALVLTAGGLAGLVAMLEGNVITPWLTSRAGELNTVAVFVGVLFWGWLWGIWGLLLAVPLMVVMKAAAEHIEPLAPLAELLGQ